jgi:hypothetical protein
METKQTNKIETTTDAVTPKFDPNKFIRSSGETSFISRGRPDLFQWLSSIALFLAGLLESLIQLDAYNSVNAEYVKYMAAQASNSLLSGSTLANPPSLIWFYGSLVFLMVGIIAICLNLWKQLRR